MNDSQSRPAADQPQAAPPGPVTAAGANPEAPNPAGNTLEEKRKALEEKGNALLRGCLGLAFKATLVIAALAVVGTVLWCHFAGGETTPAAGVLPPAANGAPATGAATPPRPFGFATPPPVEDTAAKERQNEREFARSQQEAALALADRVRGAVKEAQEELDRYESRASGLLTSEEGKRLSAKAAAVRAVLEEKRAARPELVALDAEAGGLWASLKRVLDDPKDATLPKEQLTGRLAKLRAEAEAVAHAYRVARSRLDALVTASAGTPGATTLADAIKADRDAEHLVNAEELNARAKKARDDAARGEAELAAKEIEAAAKRAEARKLAEIERVQKEAEAALAEAKRKAEEEALRKECHAAETRQVLAPFLAKAHGQPSGFTGNKYALWRKDQAAPMSLNKLRGLGALDKGRDGLERLAQIGSGHKESGCDRPSWGLNGDAHYWSPQTFEFVQRAQELLRRLGPTLVKEGLLAE